MEAEIEPAIRNKKFVFIGGLHRSGTSILHRCLAEHPQISGFRDTGVPKDEGQHLQTVYPPAKEHGGPGQFGFASATHLDETSSLATREHAAQMMSEWREHWNMDKPILAEKSPPNLLRMRFLQDLFPNTFFIIILRHPIAVSYSTMKWTPKRVDKLINHWLVSHETFREDSESINNLLTIKYENFASNTKHVANKITGFLGIQKLPLERNIVESRNENYFQKWSETPLNRYNIPPIPPLFRMYCYYRFEQRLNHFGYSLRHPHDIQPADLPT